MGQRRVLLRREVIGGGPSFGKTSDKVFRVRSCLWCPVVCFRLRVSNGLVVAGDSLRGLFSTRVLGVAEDGTETCTVVARRESLLPTPLLEKEMSGLRR